MSTPAPTAKKTLAQLRAEKTAAAAAQQQKTKPAITTAESVFQVVKRGEHPEHLQFRLTPTHVTYANALRRTIITDVETVAFRADINERGLTSDIRIIKNSTPMSNEMLAHRIGLIPIYVNKPASWDPEKYTFKLNVVNESGEPRDITASDIEVTEDRGPEQEPLRVPNTQFFRPDPVTKATCLLAVLKGKVGAQEPEALQFEAKATIGSGRENARFMPTTSRCSYGYTIDEDPERKRELFNKWLVTSKKLSPTEVESQGDKKAQLEREFNTMEYQRCYKVNAQGEPYSFDFTIESVGVLDPVYIVARALELLKAKLLQYASIDTGDLPESIRIIPSETRGAMFDFTFQKEDHTLGNLLQTWLEQNYFDSGEVTFAGYKVPHPLRDEMVLRVGVPSKKEGDARAILAKACREAAQMFQNWSDNWSLTSGGLL